MHQSLFDLINSKYRLDERDIELCKEYFEPVLVARNRVLEEEGKVPRYLYFVVSGYVRQYHYNDKGEEVTTHINCPPGFITSYHNFIHGRRSGEFVETVTDSELLRITKPHLDLLIQQSNTFKDFSIYVIQQSLAYNEKRALELATLSAEARYKKLLIEFPDILQNVPIQYISSFLGMKPETLSRIRRQIIN